MINFRPRQQHIQSIKFSLLLASLILLILLSPVLETEHVPVNFVDELYTILLITGVYTVSGSRGILVAALCMAVPYFLLAWSGILFKLDIHEFIRFLFFTAFLCFVMVNVVRAVLNTKSITFDVLLGGIVIYLMFAMIWAVSYMAIEDLAPGSFSPIKDNAEQNWNEFLYFSLTTITTLGYGDITPVRSFARIWSTLEAVTGTLFITVFIARLVSLYRE